MAKLIIAGSRRIPSMNLNNPSDWKIIPRELYETLDNLIKNSKLKVDTVISGGAWGMDTLGEIWAADNNIPIKRLVPDWNKLGRRAGMVRNTDMAKIADALACVCTEDSRGSNHMIQTMVDMNKPVFFKYV